MIAVFDNFIIDQSLLDEIKNDDTFFSDPGIYKYWKGWWSKDAINIKQRLAQYIWGDNLPLNLNLEVDGFEYWTGLQEATGNHEDGVIFKDNLEMHFDDDVAYRKKNKDYDGIPLRPVLGCVYYPEGFEFTGGDLLIYTDGEDKSPEVIKTKPNRLVIFNPGDVAHCVSPVTEGRRGAIAINVWADEPWSVDKGYIILE